MDQIALSHQQKLALEKLRGIIDEMKEVGLELYQEYAPTLQEAGVSWQDLEALKNDIHLFGTKLKSFQVVNKKLRSSAVTVTKLDVLEILYKQENTSTARMIEEQLRAQGYEAHPSVDDQQAIQKDIRIARLRKIVGSDVA
jgi:REP element-mobilizing transposase RayT